MLAIDSSILSLKRVDYHLPFATARASSRTILRYHVDSALSPSLESTVSKEMQETLILSLTLVWVFGVTA